MPTKDEIARKLIDWHFEVEPEITEVYRFIAPDEENPSEPIKLLEVSEATFTVGRVIPFGFGATEEIPYRSVVATITSEEMQQIKSLKIPLPAGWSLEYACVYPAPSRRSQENKRWRRSKEIVRSTSAPYSRHKPLSIYRKKLGVS